MERHTGFSHICGENVRIAEGRNEASWDTRYSGGIFFSNQPLRPTDLMTRLQLDGSGHVDIGVTQTDPNSLRGPDQVRQLYLSDRYKNINNIRVHKKACEVYVQHQGHNVVSPYGTKTQRHRVSIDPKQDVWLVVCIKFGNASVAISPPSKFHDVTGENVDFERTNKQTAKLKVFNPAAICVIDRQITAKDDPVRIRIDPMLSNDGNPPNLYHVTLGVTAVKPEDLATFDPQSLSISKLPNRGSHTGWWPINMFETRKAHPGHFSNVINKCEGELTIDVTSEGELRYIHTSGTEGKIPLRGLRLFIVLELFRVSVKVLNVKNQNSSYEKQKKGLNTYQLELPTPPLPTEQSGRLPEKADDYISPMEDPPLSPFPSHSAPCESSWHDWRTQHHASWVLKRFSLLEVVAVEERSQIFERYMTDTITEMRQITLKDKSIPATTTGNQYLTLDEPMDSTLLSSVYNLPTLDIMLCKIIRKMYDLKQTISQLKNVETEQHDKMYAGYKELKLQVLEVLKQSTAKYNDFLWKLLELQYDDPIIKMDDKDFQQIEMSLHMRGKRYSKQDQEVTFLHDCDIGHHIRTLETLEALNHVHRKNKALSYYFRRSLYQETRKAKLRLLEKIYGEDLLETKLGMFLLQELTNEDQEDADKFIKAVKENDLTVLQEFEVLFKSEEVDFDQFPVNPLIILAAFGDSTEAVELVHSWGLATLNWNDQLEIPLGVFAFSFYDMIVRKATPLYVATFLKKTVIAESLIKYSDEHNIAYCMSNIQLSNPMERVFIAEIGERLKQEYREWKPSVVPGYQKDANGKSVRVFIVYSTKVVHKTNNMKEGIGLVMLRNPYMVDDEAVTVFSKEVDIDIPKQDMEKANTAIDLHSKTLWCNHSNLNIISVCTVRSKRKGDILEKCLCIVLYCSTKGVVPLGENEFPSTLALGEKDSIDIDVREGYFEFGGYPTKPSTHYHEKLKMGCNIGALSSQNGGGTLGPFVQYKGTMGFLTCAHVLFDTVHQYNVDFTDNGSNQLLVVQPATDASSRSGRPCGFVNRAIFDSSKDISVDVAVVTISDETRRPTKGRFANDHSYKYKELGFDDLPEYNNAAVLKDIKQYGTSNMVVKFGSETHLTKGYLKVDGAQVRPLSTALGLPSMATKLCMNNQYEVIGNRSGINMFQPGDSGSAVFMLEGTSLHCIGLAIGYTTYGTAVVTPIQAILDALGSDAEIEIQRFNEQ